MGAHESVSLSRPLQAGSVDVVEIQTLEPLCLLRSKLSSLDLVSKLIRPFLRVVVGPPTRTSYQLFGNGAVPDVVQVVIGALPFDVNAITSPSHIFVVERLVHVADEVHDKPRRLVAFPPAQLGIQRPSSVVCESRHDAALIFAVPLEVDAAVVGRTIFGIDEVKGPGEVSPARVPDRVGPGGDAGKVVLGVITQEVLEEDFGCVGDKVAG